MDLPPLAVLSKPKELAMALTPIQQFFQTIVPRELQLDPDLATIGTVAFFINGEGAWTVYAAEARVEPRLDPSAQISIALTSFDFLGILGNPELARPLFLTNSIGSVVPTGPIADRLIRLFGKGTEVVA